MNKCSIKMCCILQLVEKNVCKDISPIEHFQYYGHFLCPGYVRDTIVLVWVLNVKPF